MSGAVVTCPTCGEHHWDTQPCLHCASDDLRLAVQTLMVWVKDERPCPMCRVGPKFWEHSPSCPVPPLEAALEAVKAARKVLT